MRGDFFRDVVIVCEALNLATATLPAAEEFDAMLEATRGGGLVTLEAAEIIKYTHGDAGA